MAKKTAKKTSSDKTPIAEQFNTALKDKSLHAVFGIITAFFGLFLFVAFLSFIFSWKADQSIFTDGFFSLMVNPDFKADNVLGKLGAAFGQRFVYQWFGISSLAIAAFVTAIGLRIGFRITGFSLLKFFRHIAYLILWLSLFFGAIALPNHSVFGGGLGYFSATWLSNWVGAFGTWAILVVTLGIYVVRGYKITPEQLGALFQRKPKPLHETLSSDVSAPILEDVVAPEIDFDKEDEIEEEPEEETFTITHDPQEEEIEDDDDAFSFELKNVEEEAPEVKSENLPTPEPVQHAGPALEIEEEPEDEVQLDVEESVDESELSSRQAAKLVKEQGQYDPKLDLSRFKMPTLDLLNDYGASNIQIDQEELEANKNKIVETLNNYKIDIAKIKATIGPTVTLYEIVPAAGVRISKIKNLEDDIALSLSALGIRIIAPIPGKGTIGIEVPNKNPNMVSMRGVLSSEKFQHTKFDLPVALGKTISNETFVTDLAKMPHLLMAGATGQGKSVGLNAILASILYRKHPSEVKFVLVDPKKVELTLFNHIERHYLAKLPDSEEAIITDTSKVINTLNSLCVEMDNRYELLKNAMVRNLKEYNEKFVNRKLNPEDGHRFLPYIILVVDEFADLIMTAGKEVETPIARLAQLARAIGIHLIIATQRPSVNVITGIIKANFPARIAFRVTSKIDSRTILDAGGADQLIGKGDMLFSSGNDLIRLQCAFLDTPEVERICDFIGGQQGYPEAYLLPEFIGEDGGGNAAAGLDAADRDSMFEEAARIVVTHQQGSASLLQRKLKLGYNRAGRIVDQLEAAGIIGPFEGSKARQVLISDLAHLEQILNNN